MACDRTLQSRWEMSLRQIFPSSVQPQSPIYLNSLENLLLNVPNCAREWVIDVPWRASDFVTRSSQPVQHYTGQPPALISIGLRRGDPTTEHYRASIAYSPRLVKHITSHTWCWRSNGSDCDIEGGLPWSNANDVFSLTDIQSGISHWQVFQLQF